MGFDDRLIVRPARLSDATVLAQLMMDEVHWGRLRDLGLTFNTLLHRQWIDSKYGVVQVVECDGEMCGYGAGLSDTKRFFRSMVLRRGPLIAAVLVPSLFNWKNSRTIMRAVTYFPKAPKDDPRAELVSFAIKPEYRRSGLGRIILDAVIEGLESKGVTSVKLGTVRPDNEAGNAFWQAMGCRFLRTDYFYRDSQVNVYIYEIP